jgi:hypothetical protein
MRPVHDHEEKTKAIQMDTNEEVTGQGFILRGLYIARCNPKNRSIIHPYVMYPSFFALSY